MAKKPKTSPDTIAQNKRARFEYDLQDKFEAGVALAGWEVKSLRLGKCQITDAYVIFQNGEAYLVGCNISPLKTITTHVVAEPERARKLLLNRRELARMIIAVQAKGQACIATRLYWKRNRIKLEVFLGTGKKMHDKRATLKEREWNRDKARVMKAHNH